ncbi:MAG: SurA N-terminal domain-containing protein [Chloroflexia bacterium]
MQTTDPYKLLSIGHDASEAEVEAAYDRLFDRYEARAQSGDTAAISMLDRLNEAHDLLLDPKRREVLGSNAQAAARPGLRSSVDTSGRAGAAPVITKTAMGKTGADNLTVRRRAGSRTGSAYSTPTTSRLPYIVVAVLALGLVASLIYLLTTKPEAVPEPLSGNALATVNGVPIYEREFNERVERDKLTALADPLFSAFFENFQGITGTRALDVLRYDALDKLINMEVIQQQASKENRYPGPEQQAEFIAETKAAEVGANESFESFLRRIGISEAQYNKRVVENFVYTVMAEQHMPKTGSNTERTEGFIRWICETRKNYDAVVKLSFIVTENEPCTSGLPTDIPLPGITEGTPVPEPIPTAQVPVVPPAGASPTASVSPPVNR